MDDTLYGMRDRRGDWRPKEPLIGAPLFVFPPRPLAFLKWLPSYFLPWNALYFALACLFWFALTPDMTTLRTLSWDWTLWILLRNSLAVLVFYGLFERRLYIRRTQGTRFKYNARFPSDTPRKGHLFGRQDLDNMARTFGSGVPIWSAYEILILWVFANGWVPMASFAEHWPWLLTILVLAKVFHEAHFYLIHRLIHTDWLYARVHAVHHRAVNPSPWSSLSMHPVEHLLYFSGALIHLVIYSHPLLAVYQLCYAGFGAVGGHFGFDRVETSDNSAIATESYDHYLHHKYFEVNYGSGLVPFDRWLGTWHDGTPEADTAMQDRRRRREG
jgi:sterol desaturase/sphingolipid hydroxylase (fatty acid hydroxylase superfamily)